MELRDYIECGSTKCGSMKAMAEKLGMELDHVSKAKAHRRGLPAWACVRLAQLIGEDERRVIAASELVTEKNPERRAVWLPFVTEIAQAAQMNHARTVKGTGKAVIFHL
ncbi:hypothetical protein MASR1M60_19520 [Rhodocyclaceae bacterium]